MSRYTFAGHAGVTAAVGWDRPLSTFFVHVTRHDPHDDEGVTILWESTAPESRASSRQSTLGRVVNLSSA